jgi:hypothetical protein
MTRCRSWAWVWSCLASLCPCSSCPLPYLASAPPSASWACRARSQSLARCPRYPPCSSLSSTQPLGHVICAAARGRGGAHGRGRRRRQRVARCGVLYVQHSVRGGGGGEGRGGLVVVVFNIECGLAGEVVELLPMPRCCRYALGSIMGPTLGLWMVQGIGVQLTYTLFGSGIAAFRSGCCM